MKNILSPKEANEIIGTKVKVLDDGYHFTARPGDILTVIAVDHTRKSLLLKGFKSGHKGSMTDKFSGKASDSSDSWWYRLNEKFSKEFQSEYLDELKPNTSEKNNTLFNFEDL